MTAEGNLEELAVCDRDRIGRVPTQAGDHLRADALDHRPDRNAATSAPCATGRMLPPCPREASACYRAMRHNPRRRIARWRRDRAARGRIWNQGRLRLHRADRRRDWPRPASSRDPARCLRKTQIPSRSGAELYLARTRLRCRPVRSVAGSWPPPMTAMPRPASEQDQQRGCRRRDACHRNRESRTVLLVPRCDGIVDQIAGYRALLVEPLLRGRAHLFGGDRANAIRPISDVLDPQPADQCTAVPARHRYLVILGVDRLSNELSLDAIEVVGADRILQDVGNHIVENLLDLGELDPGVG